MDFANEGTLNYYPKSGYVKLVSDTAKWPARFKVPIMDEIGGGDFPQDAWLTLDWENAEKISNDTPDEPVKEALGQAITIAETAVREHRKPGKLLRLLMPQPKKHIKRKQPNLWNVHTPLLWKLSTT